MNRPGLLALALGMLCWARLVQAQTSVAIVVPHVSTTDYEVYEHRLRSELLAEGFQPVSVEVTMEISPQTLKKQATRLMSPAAISMSIHDDVISGLVWIRARGNGSDLLRSVPDYPLSDQAPTIFAVRAADVLHGGLLELGYIGTTPEPIPDASRVVTKPGSKSTEPSPATVKPTPPAGPAQPRSADAPIPTKPKREQPAKAWHLRGLAHAGVHSLEQPSWGLHGSFMRRLSPNIGVGVAAASFFPAARSANQSAIAIRQAYAGPRLESQQLLSKSLSLFEYVETGVYGVFVTSRTYAPNVARSPRMWSGYSSLGFGAVWSTSSVIGLVAQAGLLLPWSSAPVVVLDNVVAQAGAPALLLSGGLQLAF